MITVSVTDSVRNKRDMVSNQHWDDDCPLCAELTDDNCLSSLLNLYQSRDSKILAETNTLVLMPDISPIVPGHSLIITKNHYFSFSEIANNVWNELSYIKRMARKILGKYSALPFLFEHGSCSGSSLGAACIAHAHIHVIPATIRVLPYLARISEYSLRMTPIKMKSAVPRKSCAYLYYEDRRSMGCVILVPNMPLPRQFIRMIVAKEARISEWDWRSCLANRITKSTNSSVVP